MVEFQDTVMFMLIWFGILLIGLTLLTLLLLSFRFAWDLVIHDFVSGFYKLVTEPKTFLVTE